MDGWMDVVFLVPIKIYYSEIVPSIKHFTIFLRWLNKWNTPSRVCACEIRDTVFHHISNVEKRHENTMRNGVILMNIEVFRFWGERWRKDVEYESFNLGTYPNKSRFRIFFVYGLWTINEIEKCQINSFNSAFKKKRENPQYIASHADVLRGLSRVPTLLVYMTSQKNVRLCMWGYFLRFWFYFFIPPIPSWYIVM